MAILQYWPYILLYWIIGMAVVTLIIFKGFGEDVYLVHVLGFGFVWPVFVIFAVYDSLQNVVIFKAKGDDLRTKINKIK